MSHNQPAVQVTDLVKRYIGSNTLLGAYQFKRLLTTMKGNAVRNIVALDGVTFSIAHGQVFGLLGPNGAGKTTLIKILSTLVLPDSGRALVNGVDVVKNPRRSLKMLQTVLAESAGFERRLTARQNLEFYASLYGIPKDIANRRIEEILEYFHMTDKADWLFQKYSTGLGRRLLICRALLSEAPIILFDEPTSGLDPVSAAEFRKLLTDVLAKEKGKTILLSTHNLWEAQNICDTIAVLRKGKLSAIGPPSEIRYTSADTVTITLSLSFPFGVSPKDVVDRIEALGASVTFVPMSGMDSRNLTLTIEAIKDIDYNRLFEILLSMKIRIVSIEASQPSLEEAFLKLTTQAIDNK